MRAFVILVVLGCWAAGLAGAITCHHCTHTVVNITKEDADRNGFRFQAMYQRIAPECDAGPKNWNSSDLWTVQCKRCGYIHTAFDFTYKEAEGNVQMFSMSCDDKLEQSDMPDVSCATGVEGVAQITKLLEKEIKDIKVSNVEPSSKACNCDVPMCDDNPIPAEEAVKCYSCGYVAVDITDGIPWQGSEFKEKYENRSMKNCKPGTTDFSGMVEKTCRKRCGFVNTKLDFNANGAKGEMRFFGMGCDDYPYEEEASCTETEKGRDNLVKMLEYQFDIEVLQMHNDSIACSCNGENCAAGLAELKKSAIAASAGDIVPSLVLIVMAAALKVFY